MKKLTRTSQHQNHPIKVIQFGEGNFLRAFVDWMIDILNEKSDFAGSVAIVQPLENGMVDMLSNQDGLYHLLRQGLDAGQTIDEARLIQTVTRCIDPFKDTAAYFQLAEVPSVELIFSNTTEAGIVFDPNDQPAKGALAHTFPGKLTQLLHHRFHFFDGAVDKGVSIIPCELIEDNGSKLKNCIKEYIQLWNLSTEFQEWMNQSCHFANTLVDRIVPGYPKDEIEAIRERIGFDDQLVVKSESFHLFVIQAPEPVQKAFPAHKYGLNVKYVPDITPYRTQKVRILNGAHTAMVPIGLLYGLETVSESVNDNTIGKLIHQIIFDEIVPTIQIPGEDPRDFANQVIARFQNPFIRHELITISLNSISKFKVRVLPTFLDHTKAHGTPPKRMAFSLACLIRLYLSGKFPVKDNEEYLAFFDTLKSKPADEIISATLSNTDLWGQDLSQVNGLQELLTTDYQAIVSDKMTDTIKELLK